MKEGLVNKIKITACSVEEFNEIKEKLMLLDDNVLEQIEKAENGVIQCTCTFDKYIVDKDGGINLPHTTRQIANNGDYIAFYTSNHFFKLPLYDGAKIPTYNINQPTKEPIFNP